MTDIKEKIEELAEKIMKDSALQAQFKKDPVKAVEKLLGVDLPDDVIDKVVKALQEKRFDEAFIESIKAETAAILAEIK